MRERFGAIERPFDDVPLPRPDRRLVAHGPVDRQQRRPDHAPGAGRGPRRGPEPAHELPRRGARPADRGSGPARPADPADPRLRGRRHRDPRPAGRLVLRRDAHRRARGGGARPTSTRSTRMGGTLAAIEARLPAAPDPGVGLPGPAGDRARASRSSWASTASGTMATGARRPIQRIDPEGERRQVEGVRRVRAERDAGGLGGGDATPRGRRAGRRQPAAADHRGRQGLCHGRRDRDRLRVASGASTASSSRSERGGPVCPEPRRRREPRPGADPRLGRSITSPSSSRDSRQRSGSGATSSGCPSRSSWTSSSDRVTIAFLAVGESKVELVQPTDDTTGVARFLAKQGRGLPPRLLRGRDLAAELTRLGSTGSSSSTRRPRRGAEGPWRSCTRGPATASSWS